jgi:hypothetical protein
MLVNYPTSDKGYHEASPSTAFTQILLYLQSIRGDERVIVNKCTRYVFTLRIKSWSDHVKRVPLQGCPKSECRLTCIRMQ